MGDKGSEKLFQMVEKKRREYREAMHTYLVRRFPELRESEDTDAWAHREYA